LGFPAWPLQLTVHSTTVEKWFGNNQKKLQRKVYLFWWWIQIKLMMLKSEKEDRWLISTTQFEVILIPEPVSGRATCRKRYRWQNNCQPQRRNAF
jgi:hypothetical protein